MNDEANPHETWEQYWDRTRGAQHGTWAEIEKVSRMVKAKAEWERVRDAVPAMLAMLRELEWGNDGWPRCTVCDGFSARGHSTDCRLAALFASLP